MTLSEIARRFRAVAPSCESWTLRLVRGASQGVVVRNDVLEPLRTLRDLGAMVSVADGDGMGYAATCDLSAAGLQAASARAQVWARMSAGRCATRALPATGSVGTFRSRTAEPWGSRGLPDIVAQLQGLCARLKRGPEIVDRVAALEQGESETHITSSAGGEIAQHFSFIQPFLSATASRANESQTRTFGRETARQGGFEQLRDLGFDEAAERIADEARALLAAADCPTGTMDVVLMPSQMTLQVHESIGHPLELDRILGDERNYAGTSFVTQDMFGAYRYGSPLLNVTFDPARESELASYAFDDEGTPATRAFLIKEGVLLRGLGGALSQSRSGLTSAPPMRGPARGTARRSIAWPT